MCDIDTFENVSGYSTNPKRVIKDIVDVLDYELDVNMDAMGRESNYGGTPQGEPSHAFDWRKC